MPADTDPTPGAPRPAPALSPLTAALGLAAIAVVAAGAAWVGHARQPAGPRAGLPAAPGAPPAALAAMPGAIAADARALLDGGNAAFRAGRYEAALAHYRAAAARAPGDAAPWYGVRMAAQKLGRAALADSAMAAIRARSGDAAMWDEGAVREAHEAVAPTGASPRR